MKYFVTMAGRELELELDGDVLRRAGEEIHVSLEAIPGSPVHLLRVGQAVHRLTARRIGPNEYDLSLDGHRLTAVALDERARAIRALSATTSRPAGPAKLVAPMPGLIVRVGVAQGDAIRAGQGLVVMEAMKMENELRAPGAGVVTRVVAAAGQTVEKGALLLELESRT